MYTYLHGKQLFFHYIVSLTFASLSWPGRLKIVFYMTEMIPNHCSELFQNTWLMCHFKACSNWMNVYKYLGPNSYHFHFLWLSPCVIMIGPIPLLCLCFFLVSCRLYCKWSLLLICSREQLVILKVSCWATITYVPVANIYSFIMHRHSGGADFCFSSALLCLYVVCM